MDRSASYGDQYYSGPEDTTALSLDYVLPDSDLVVNETYWKQETESEGTGYEDEGQDYLWPLNHLLISAIVLLSLAIVVWVITWLRNWKNSPYRYLLILLFLSSALLYCVLFLVSLDIFLPSKAELVAFVYSLELGYDVSMCSLVGYVALCLVKVVNNLVTSTNIVVCVLLCTGPAAVFRGVVCIIQTYAIESMTPPTYTLLHLLTKFLPYLVLLTGAAVLDMIIIYKLFFTKNPKSREHKYIAVTTVGLMVILVERGIYEFMEMLSLYQLIHWRLMQSYMLHSVPLFAILGSVFLCYLDLEVWTCLPCITIEDDYSPMEEDTVTLKPNKDAETPSTGNENGGGQTGSHVASFEMDITPRISLQQTKTVYGAIPERR